MAVSLTFITIQIRCLNEYRWLFYIEGGLTVAIAFMSIFILPDFPTTTRWLSPQERALAIKRMEEDAGVGDEHETEEGIWSGLIMALTDWKVWWLSLALTSEVVALSFNAFFPTLSATLGFNTTVTLLLCAPPFVFSALVAFLLSWYADTSPVARDKLTFEGGTGLLTSGESASSTSQAHLHSELSGSLSRCRQ
jgi:hypothetical protein